MTWTNNQSTKLKKLRFTDFFLSFPINTSTYYRHLYIPLTFIDTYQYFDSSYSDRYYVYSIYYLSARGKEKESVSVSDDPKENRKHQYET